MKPPVTSYRVIANTLGLDKRDYATSAVCHTVVSLTWAFLISWKDSIQMFGEPSWIRKFSCRKINFNKCQAIYSALAKAHNLDVDSLKLWFWPHTTQVPFVSSCWIVKVLSPPVLQWETSTVLMPSTRVHSTPWVFSISYSGHMWP